MSKYIFTLSMRPSAKTDNSFFDNVTIDKATQKVPDKMSLLYERLQMMGLSDHPNVVLSNG